MRLLFNGSLDRILIVHATFSHIIVLWACVFWILLEEIYWIIVVVVVVRFVFHIIFLSIAQSAQKPGMRTDISSTSERSTSHICDCTMCFFFVMSNQQSHMCCSSYRHENTKRKRTWIRNNDFDKNGYRIDEKWKEEERKMSRRGRAVWWHRPYFAIFY